MVEGLGKYINMNIETAFYGTVNQNVPKFGPPTMLDKQIPSIEKKI